MGLMYVETEFSIVANYKLASRKRFCVCVDFSSLVRTTNEHPPEHVLHLLASFAMSDDDLSEIVQAEIVPGRAPLGRINVEVCTNGDLVAKWRSKQTVLNVKSESLEPDLSNLLSCIQVCVLGHYVYGIHMDEF